MNDYPVKAYMSYSQISSFMRCPFCFSLTYIKKVPRQKSKYMSAGSAFHSFAELYKPGMDADELLIQEFLKYQDGYEDKSEGREMYAKMVKGKDNYLLSEYAKKEPIFTEMKFKDRLFADESIPPMYGFIDRVDGELGKPETYEVTDFKTSGSTKPKADLATDLQMPIYAMILYRRFGVFPARITYYYPVIDKYQSAVHIGDGVYEYENQKKPIVVVDVKEKMQVLYDVIAEIRQSTFEKKAMHFFCHPECRACADGWSLL